MHDERHSSVSQTASPRIPVPFAPTDPNGIMLEDSRPQPIGGEFRVRQIGGSRQDGVDERIKPGRETAKVESTE